MSVSLPADELAAFCALIFASVGSSAAEARAVAESLVDSNLTGHDSHGVIRVPRYVDWVISGDLIPNQTLDTLVDAPCFAVLDGRFGFGQTMAPLAVDIGVDAEVLDGHLGHHHAEGEQQEPREHGPDQAACQGVR